MLRVGLTGGIGAGKSTVARRLVTLGAILIDADALAREVVAPGSDGLEAVLEAFGSEVLAPDGGLDRAAVAARVFGDEDALRRLNAIVHPRVGARSAALVSEAPPDAILVQDIPLLVENRLAPMFHLVVVVDAPIDVRVSRLVEQRGLPEADARARMANQVQEAERRIVADVWLDNSGAHDIVEAAVERLWRNRLVPFEQNLRAGRPAPFDNGGPWEGAATRLAARIAHALGGATVEPVAERELVASEIKDAADLPGKLAAAGFVPFAEGYANADPGQPARLLIRPFAP